MRMYQSTEDGSMNILAACFDPSTDFLKGPAKQMKFDKGFKVTKRVFGKTLRKLLVHLTSVEFFEAHIFLMSFLLRLFIHSFI